MKPLILLFYTFRCAACIPFRTYFLVIEQLIRDARGPPLDKSPGFSQVDLSRTSCREDEQQE